MRPVVLLLSVVLVVPLVCWGQKETLNIEQILARMQQARAAERDHSIAYTVTREYQLAAEGASQPSSDVIAQVSFVPPSAKEYAIVKAEGSDRGAGIVRKVLDHETSMASKPQPHEIDAANYDIALSGRESLEGHDCYVLQLSPKREAVELVRGQAWVDARSFQVRRISGVTSKNPSFWIKKLNVTINYGEVNGVWLQTSTKAVADVRVAGTHTLSSRAIDMQPSTVNASMHIPSKPSSRRANPRTSVADAATWVAR